jgi:sporulation protein YlmC with PRC-barrel domain
LVELGKLNWKTVESSDGVVVGSLQGGDLDTTTWQVTHIHVGLNEEASEALGLSRPYLGQVIVCLPVSFVKKVNEKVILEKSFEQLKNEKECQEFVTE